MNLSTAQLPDPARSPHVSKLSEGDPSLIVDSSDVPRSSARPVSLSQDVSLDDAPTKPAVRNRPVASPNVEHEIQIIPRTRSGGTIRSAEKQPLPATKPVAKASAKDGILLATADGNAEVKPPADPSPFQRKPKEWDPSVFQKEGKPVPSAAPAAPQEFPPPGELKPMPARAEVGERFAADAAAKPVAAHAPRATTSTGIDAEEAPGESSTPWLWIALLVLIAGIAVAVRKRRQLNFA